MLADSDTTVPTAIARLSVARLDDAKAAARVLGWLNELNSSHAGLDDAAVRLALGRLVKEFRAGKS